MPTHNLLQQWRATGSSLTVEQTTAVTADGEDNRTLVIPDSTTDQEVFISIDFSALKMLFMLSTKAVTVETNVAAPGTDTISLAANIPYIFVTGGTTPNPFTADVTKFFITNASGGSATIEIRVLQDSTP